MSVSQWGAVLTDEMHAAHVPEGQLFAWSLGGPSLAVKSSRAFVLIDPFTGSPSEGVWLRMVAVPYDPADLRDVDAVFSTHDHDDHCHRDTLVPIAEHTDARFVGPSSSAKKMRTFGLPNERIAEAVDGQRFTFGDITVTAARVPDFADPTSLGWIVSVDGGPTLFHAGDGMSGPEYARIAETHEITAAALSVASLLPDGEKIYLDAQDAVIAAEQLDARVLIPIHWDLWRVVQYDPWEIVTTVQQMRSPLVVHIPRLGEAMKLTTNGVVR